jgi:hypothetical protein
MATTTRSTSGTARRAPRGTTGKATPRPTRDNIPPHWPDELDVPVPSLAGGAEAAA